MNFVCKREFGLSGLIRRHIGMVGECGKILNALYHISLTPMFGRFEKIRRVLLVLNPLTKYSYFV